MDPWADTVAVVTMPPFEDNTVEAVPFEGGGRRFEDITAVVVTELGLTGGLETSTAVEVLSEHDELMSVMSRAKDTWATPAVEDVVRPA